MSYLAFNSSINDNAYFSLLLSFQWVARRETTAEFCLALVNVNQQKGGGAVYKWWKLRRHDYKLFKP